MRRIDPGISLEAQFPELATQWHPDKNGDLTPADLIAESNKKIWWKCPAGPDHEWVASAMDRTVRRRGCGFCAGKRISVTNCFEILHPSRARCWHPEKNGESLPNQFVSGSNRVVWWRCEQGHEWRARIEKVSKGHWCPFCAGKRATPENNFAVQHPDLLELWHPTKNRDFRPEEVAPNSDRKTWWQCDLGHEWLAQVKRVSRGGRCPKCANRIRGEKRRSASVKRWGSIAESNPELAEQWHEKNELRPDQVSPKSIARIFWRCRRGHVWSAQVRERVDGTGCSRCHRQTSMLEIRIFAELKQSFPDSIWQARLEGMVCDILVPSERIVVEVDGYPWHMNGLERDQAKSKRIKQHGYTLLRARDEKLPGIDDLTVPIDSSRKYDVADIARRILERIATTRELPASAKTALVFYREHPGVLGDASANQLISELDRGIPEHRLSETHPRLLIEWDSERNGPLELDAFTAGSNTSVWWLCSNGHSWKVPISNRAIGETGCRKCLDENLGSRTRTARLVERGSLAETHPELAASWHPSRNGKISPEDRTAGSSERVWWVCAEGHEWKAQIGSRAEGSGCRECWKQSRLAHKGSLAATRPDLAAEWHPLRNRGVEPTERSQGSEEKVWWLCADGHEWQARIDSRARKNGSNCPVCQRVRNGSLETARPELMPEWHWERNEPAKPSELAPKSNRVVWWRCDCGYEWEARIAGRRGPGCPLCKNQKRIHRRSKAKRS